MYLPNPLAFAAAKVAAYSLLGAMIKARGMTKRSALGFGVVRTILGWAIGIPIIAIGMALFGELTSQGLVMWMALPRLILSAFLVHCFFRPRHGWRETLAWAAASVAIASAIDLAIMANYERAQWLRIPWC